MKALNKETAAKTQRPERIIQFGEGNFLWIGLSTT